MSLHIGEKIRKRAEELGIGQTELGRRINSSKQNVNGIFNRESIDTEILRAISKALSYDFFQYYQLDLDPKDAALKIEKPARTTATLLKDFHRLQEEYRKTDDELQRTKLENASLKREVSLLKKLNGLFGGEKEITLR